MLSYPNTTPSKVIAPRTSLRVRSAVPVNQVRSRLQDLEDPLGAHAPPLDKPPGLHQGVERPIQRGEIGEEDQHLADGELAGEHMRCPDPEHHGGAPCHHNVDERGVQGLEGVETEVGVQACRARRDELPVLVLFGGEGLDHPDGADDRAGYSPRARSP